MILLQELLQSPSSVALLTALLVFLVFWLLSTNHKRVKEPPGPRSLPLIGNLLQLDLRRLDLSLWRLSKKYGSVFTVHFGPKKVVVLTGFRTVKEALVNHAVEFGDREILPTFYDYSEGHGVLFSNGDSWKEMRHFALSTLRDLGMGQRGSEEKIIEEIYYMTEVFENFQGKPFDTREAVNRSVSNIISSIVYGSRFEYDDPEFQRMVNRANQNIRLMVSPAIQLYNMFPRLGPWLKEWITLKKNIETNTEQIKGLVKNLQDNLNAEDRRSLVDSFLIRQQEMKKHKEQEFSYYHEKNLIITVSNLFAADTTGTTLRWGLLLMAKYPHVQDRVQEELDRVIGGRQSRVEDRKTLPYTDAVIHEIQRLANIAPMSLPHITSCDVVFQGYHIKKGTPVIPLLTSVLYDESEWESPHTFNPGHFLDDQGRFRKRDAFLPFSAGRRVCLGESLVRMELFLVFTSLLQKFRFTPPPGVSESDLDLTPAVGLTLDPSPHKLCAVNRA